ncbi:sensor histidine kinase [Kitasatospora sp. NPDC058965]|uniref:sensor histidine kinase n=1 Tax=Kitasatospora sp. NPDC058965 TaxID=3346682 RepID=UPI0036A4D79D
MRAWITGRRAADWAVSLSAVLVTAAGSSSEVAAWLPGYAIVPLALAQGSALLARRRVPLAVLGATTALGTFLLAVGYPAGSAAAGACCAAYAVGAYRSSGAEPELALALRGAASAVLAGAALVAAGLLPDARSQGGLWGSITVGVLVAASWVLGYAVQTRRAYIAQLKDRAARLEAEEGERAARAVLDERLRIARELHDVIGHSISLVTVQAEAAARAARTDPAAVPDYLARIAAAGRQALGEMRSVVAVLRPDQEAGLSPQPGLDQLDDLVAGLRAGGLPVRLDLEPMALPPGLALTVYRIVQESLTNVLKHAGADAQVAVTVARSAHALRVCVRDDGAGPQGRADSAAHGIVGMRERVAAYGGTLTTGARPEGGFQVDALIPLPEEAA